MQAQRALSTRLRLFWEWCASAARISAVIAITLTMGDTGLYIVNGDPRISDESLNFGGANVF